MKSYKSLLAVTMLATAFLTACGDEDEVTNAPTNAPTEQSNDTTQTSTEAAFNFTKFSLDVEYSGDKSIDASYENESTGVEAEYENDLTSERIYGNDAYSKMEPLFKGFSFDQSTPDDQVMKQVKDAFKIDEGYQEFELEVRFSDGVEKEYREVK